MITPSFFSSAQDTTAIDNIMFNGTEASVYGDKSVHYHEKGASSLISLCSASISGVSNLCSGTGGTSTYITFTNELDIAVGIDWIDFDGKRKNYTTLRPGQRHRQQTYVNHPWVVYSGTDDSIIAVFHPAEEEARARITSGHRWTRRAIFTQCVQYHRKRASSLVSLRSASISEISNLCSGTGGTSTYITFINELDIAVGIDWIDFDGKRKNYTTLRPGKRHRQQTYVNHPWVVHSGTDDSVIAVFHPAKEEARARITSGHRWTRKAIFTQWLKRLSQFFKLGYLRGKN